MKKIINIIIGVLLTIGLTTSCSNDGDEINDNKYGNLTVNGQSCRVYSATCSFRGTITDDLGEFEIPPHGGFSMQLEFDESFYYFEFTIDDLSSQDHIVVGQNLVNDGAVEVHFFHRLTMAELSTRYSDEDGRLSIKKKGNGFVIVDFSNFSFVKDTGKSKMKYTMKGDVRFDDINAD